MYYCNYFRSNDSEKSHDLDDIYKQKVRNIAFYCPYYRQFFRTAFHPSTFVDYPRETPGQKPLSFVGAYLTEISNNTSTTGADITTTAVPTKPLIKVVFDKDVVGDNVWENNQKAVTMQNSAGANVPIQVSRISDTVNFNERRNIFVTPLSNLLSGEKYRIVVSPNLMAKNLYSTLGMTTNNQPVIVNFTTAGMAIIPVTGVTLNRTAITITEGQTATLVATVQPANATNKAVNWTSSNPLIASVNQSGVVTAILPGTAVITVTTVSGGKTASSAVTVALVQIIYYVKPGDTLYKIAQIYGLVPNDLIIANNLNPNAYLYVGQPIFKIIGLEFCISGNIMYNIAIIGAGIIGS